MVFGKPQTGAADVGIFLKDAKVTSLTRKSLMTYNVSYALGY
jgi:hypothetical protein